MTSLEITELRVCPGCGASNEVKKLSAGEYRCPQCNLELAHLDVAANGVIRGVFGWLHAEGDLIEGRYRIKSVLGKGGFGATYLVEDVRLNGKRRALKEVPALLFDEYETTLLSRLNHPSIPDIIDRIEADGMIYLVLEFGGSRTLGGERKQYPEQRIPQAKLLPWMRQLCEVLVYLHSQDPPIIHRDLKPDNILLDETGRIMLIDFGIAKESKPATMTRTLGRAATHGFSPPEQAMGTGTDERSDIYALAATFYALLTGENPPAAHERVAGKELVPASQIVPDLSPQVEATIMQALNLNVNKRQQSVLEFSRALDGIDTADTSHTVSNTSYAERTVLLGKTSRPTYVHPPSIKLPSERISELKAEPPSEEALAEKFSRRNLILLIAGITVFLAILLTAGYHFWPESKPEKEPIAQTAKESGNQLPRDDGRSSVNIENLSSSTEITPSEQKGPSVIEKDEGTSSALKAFEDELQKQGNQPSPPKQPVINPSEDVATQKEQEAEIKAEQERKMREAEKLAEKKRREREAEKRAEKERKQREAAKRAEYERKRKEEEKRKNAQKNWLDNFNATINK